MGWALDYLNMKTAALAHFPAQRAAMFERAARHPALTIPGTSGDPLANSNMLPGRWADAARYFRTAPRAESLASGASGGYPTAADRIPEVALANGRDNPLLHRGDWHPSFTEGVFGGGGAAESAG